MSRIRTGHNPEDWLVLEPATGRAHHSRLGIAGGGPPIVVGGIGNPIVGGGFVVGKSSEYDPRRHRKRDPNVEPETGPSCGEPMPGDVCARRLGHRWLHRTRSAMDEDARQRRSTRVFVDLSAQGTPTMEVSKPPIAEVHP